MSELGWLAGLPIRFWLTTGSRALIGVHAEALPLICYLCGLTCMLSGCSAKAVCNARGADDLHEARGGSVVKKGHR